VDTPAGRLRSRTAGVIAAKGATSVIPIVFGSVADPVGAGLVASLARPGGNVTGLSNQSADMPGKRFELLRGRQSFLARAFIDRTTACPETGALQSGTSETKDRAAGRSAFDP
jgi:ABC transporter substrate binding protein